ncbi:alpha/beta fold hydrolase [Gillisia sp. Hel_I_29]|uniref:alpha/beta fold hydrolase n=1 Tax=Gillisia sp. Hel_I_29 TaxID=1249975 RepID=UPI00054EA7F3|nr:alpha/beta fold hydrolase [Gillisia sp. Hel_I_29]
MLQEIKISEFKNSAGSVQDIHLTYEIFGKPLASAPVVLINHALTGNSSVIGNTGWWKEIVGDVKSIDTQEYTILAFNVPGNGYDGKEDHLLNNYKDFTLRDIAKIYQIALNQLGITKIFAGIGGSIGGALLWEQAVLSPELFEHIIPVASDYKATHWVKALCKVQEQILNNSNTPVADARMQAMTFYRSPQSFISKFGSLHGEQNSNWNIEGWLEHHGRKLEERFQLASYKLMNHLLTTADISLGSGDHITAASKINSNIHIITINSDGFFTPFENWETYVNLSLIKNNISIHEIKSIHGHDAFLIEHSQVATFLKPIFNINKTQNEKDKHSTVWSR